MSKGNIDEEVIILKKEYKEIEIFQSGSIRIGVTHGHDLVPWDNDDI